MIAVSLACLILSCLAISEYGKPENFQTGTQKKEPIKLRDCWNLLKENRALQMYIVAAASDKLALTTAGNTVFSTLLFGILIGNMSITARMVPLWNGFIEVQQEYPLQNQVSAKWNCALAWMPGWGTWKQSITPLPAHGKAAGRFWEMGTWLITVQFPLTAPLRWPCLMVVEYTN